MRGIGAIGGRDKNEALVIRGACCALGPDQNEHCTMHISGGRIASIALGAKNAFVAESGAKSEVEIDLSGYLLLPGLINAHDHLEFALYPRMGNPPYENYVDWGEDIHKIFCDAIAEQHEIPKGVRTWWGGLRNLLCGVTTVAHHNPLLPQMPGDDFPVRVVQDYGWAHSLALGGDLRAARAATPPGHAFIVHACEGVDELARGEIRDLDEMGLLDESMVLVHGLALDKSGVALMKERGAALIVCPSSNYFLFQKVPDLRLLGGLERVALGSDSPLTAAGDLLDEVWFAIHICDVSPREAYRMVTEVPAAILRLSDSEGFIRESGIADLIAVRDTGKNQAERLRTLSMDDIELVLLGGRVQLASDAMLGRLPPADKQELEPLTIGTVIRWLRAPVDELLRDAETVLGTGHVRLGGRAVCAATTLEVEHAC